MYVPLLVHCVVSIHELHYLVLEYHGTARLPPEERAPPAPPSPPPTLGIYFRPPGCWCSRANGTDACVPERASQLASQLVPLVVQQPAMPARRRLPLPHPAHVQPDGTAVGGEQRPWSQENTRLLVRATVVVASVVLAGMVAWALLRGITPAETTATSPATATASTATTTSAAAARPIPTNARAVFETAKVSMEVLLTIDAVVSAVQRRELSVSNALMTLSTIGRQLDTYATVHARLALAYMDIGGPPDVAFKHLKRQIELLQQDTEKANAAGAGSVLEAHHGAAAAEEAQQLLAEAQYAAATHLMITKGERREITAHLQAALSLDPVGRRIPVAAARHWLALQLSRQPRKSAETAVLLRDTDHAALTAAGVNPLDSLMLLGQAEDRLGNLAASAAAYRHAAQLYASQMATARSRGGVLDDRLQYRFALAHFQLCKALYLLGRLDEAARTAAEALSNPAWAGHVFQLHDIAALIQVSSTGESYSRGMQLFQRERRLSWTGGWCVVPSSVSPRVIDSPGVCRRTCSLRRVAHAYRPLKGMWRAPSPLTRTDFDTSRQGVVVAAARLVG